MNILAIVQSFIKLSNEIQNAVSRFLATGAAQKIAQSWHLDFNDTGTGSTIDKNYVLKKDRTAAKRLGLESG